MKILFIIPSLLIIHPIFSQKMDVEFGQLSAGEMEMTHYEKDKEAKAVVLFDIGKSIFYDTDGGYDIRFTRHKRIKIFDNGESQHTEVSIPYYVDGYGKEEVVKSIEAITYNSENGRLTQKRLDPSTIYEEQLNKRWFNKKFVFPDVQDGAILEFRYVLETPFHFNLPDWRFQGKIPTIYSEYTVNMIPFYEYVFLVQGVSKFDYQNSVISKEKRTWGSVSEVYGQTFGNGVEFQDYIHTYVMKNVPAFRDESYITSINDYIIKMDFQLAKFHTPQGVTSNIISGWPVLNETLLKHEKFGKYIKNSSREAKKILKEKLELAGLNDQKKAEKIIDYVKNSFEWNNYYGKYASQSPKDLVTNKNGNAADINLFMIAMLNAAGIRTQPLILSTRNHGKIHFQYPFDHFTNYVIALVNTNSPFLADGTESLLPYNKLPTRCFNEKGLVVNKDDEPNWIGLSNTASSLEKNTIDIGLDPVTLNARTKVFVQSTSYKSFAQRRRFKDDTIKLKEYYASRIGTIHKIQTLGYKKLKLPYSVNFEGSYETEKVGNTIVIVPFLHLPLSKNNLVQKKRSYPVDFVHPWEDQFESRINIPNGFDLVTTPRPYTLEDDLAKINLTYDYSKGVFEATGSYKFKKATYSASEYTKIKRYLDDIIKYFNQPLVLEKTN